MQVELSYGRGNVAVTLPSRARVTVIRKPAMPILPDPATGVAAALSDPVGCAPLAALAHGRRSACILICDITRPVPNGLLLPPIIRTLLDAGIPREHIVVLVATGLHRPNLGAELDELVGDRWVRETVRVQNHYARNDEDHVDLGRTPHGTVVRLDRRFVEADLRIATGLVEPHFMAGYSGGRKVIAPGIAHAETQLVADGIRALRPDVLGDGASATLLALTPEDIAETRLALALRKGVHAVAESA